MGVAVIATATDHCCALIVKCKHEIIRRMVDEKLAAGMDRAYAKEQENILGRTLSFGRIGKYCMGRTGLLLVNVSVMVTQFGFCIGYFIFLGNTMRTVVYQLLPNSTNIHNTSAAADYFRHPELFESGAPNRSGTFSVPELFSNSAALTSDPFAPESLRKSTFESFAVLVAIPVPFLILISFVRNLRKLGPVSILANGSLTGAFTATAIYMLASRYSVFRNSFALLFFFAANRFASNVCLMLFINYIFVIGFCSQSSLTALNYSFGSPIS